MEQGCDGLVFEPLANAKSNAEATRRADHYFFCFMERMSELENAMSRIQEGLKSDKDIENRDIRYFTMEENKAYYITDDKILIGINDVADGVVDIKYKGIPNKLDIGHSFPFKSRGRECQLDLLETDVSTRPNAAKFGVSCK